MSGLLRISWSQLRVWSECAAKSKLTRAGHRSPAQNIRGFFHGTVVDLVMRTWLSEGQQELGVMSGMVAEWVERAEVESREKGNGFVRWKSTTDKQEMTEFCQELVVRLETILCELVLPYDYEPSKRFQVPVQVPSLTGEPVWILLIGETDLLTRTPDGRFNCWDLKATKDSSYWRKTQGQLVFYDIAIEAMFGEPCKQIGLIQPMCEERVLPFNFTDQDRREMWSRIIRYCEALWRREGEPHPSSHCTYCEVKHACSRFQPVAGSRRVSLLG